jgi:beta-xylosidase
MYAYVSYDEEEACLILDILVCEHAKTRAVLGEKRIRIPNDVERICIAVEVKKERLQFFYAFQEEVEKKVGRRTACRPSFVWLYRKAQFIILRKYGRRLRSRYV